MGRPPALPHMHTPVALNEIRSAILKGRRVTFYYEHERVTADFYLLGHARKTRAYVVVAWCHGPWSGWRHLRYSLIQDLERVGDVVERRGDFDPYDPKIVMVDTQAYRPTRLHH